MSRSLAAALALAVSALVVLPAAAPARPPQEAAEAAAALWRAQDVRSYSFRLRISCFCPREAQGPFTIVVRGGRPSKATPDIPRDLMTIPRQLRLIRLTLADPEAGGVSVAYDARRGFPRTAGIDRIRLALDDELGWSVDRFRLLR